MVLQGDDDGHEGRDGRRRGLPSEASGGRYATHCWALTRPLGRLGRHRLVSGGAIAQQWLVDREHDYASIYASIYAISCFDAPSCHDRYCCCCCCYGLRYCYRYCCAGPLRQVRTGCDGGLYGDDGRRLRGQGASARRRSSTGRRFRALRRVHRTNYEGAGGRVCGGDEFGTLPRCGANRNAGGMGPRGTVSCTKP